MRRSLRAARILGGEVRATGRTVARALRRRSTYPGAIKEALWTGVQVAMYPIGLVSEAIEADATPALGGRFTPQLPLRYLDPEAATTPIVLVHGYFHNRSAFVVMRRALRRYGFLSVDTFNYSIIGHDVLELAARLAAHVDDVLATTGAHRVHVVGHSLGGIVARYYIQELGGEEKVHTCITLGSPHNGTHAAFAGRGRAAREIRPGSELLRLLDEGARASDVRYVSYYSNLDALVIPASSAKLTHPKLRARNVLVKDHGHMSLLISRPLIRSIAETLAHLDVPNEEPSEVLPLRASRRRASGRTGAGDAQAGR